MFNWCTDLCRSSLTCWILGLNCFGASPGAGQELAGRNKSLLLPEGHSQQWPAGQKTQLTMKFMLVVNIHVNGTVNRHFFSRNAIKILFTFLLLFRSVLGWQTVPRTTTEKKSFDYSAHVYANFSRP